MIVKPAYVCFNQKQALFGSKCSIKTFQTVYLIFQAIKMGLDHLEWVPASGGDVPKDAIRAGVDSGNKCYVARAHMEGGLIPGKLHKTHSSVYIPFNMKEVPVDDYEVL